MKRTLGTQLRHLTELLDSAVEQAYVEAGLDYKPRYTPVMRTLARHKKLTINQLAEAAGITQPAATQTVGVMETKGLVQVLKAEEDGRKRWVELTSAGQAMLSQLQTCWSATAVATAGLESELDLPLSTVIEQAIAALEHTPFARRIALARQQLDNTTTKTTEEL